MKTIIKRNLPKASIFLMIFLALTLAQTVAYGAVTIIPQSGTDPELIEIVHKVVDSFYSFVEQKLHLTFAREVKVFVCPNQNSYTDVLQSEFKLSKPVAERRAKLTGGIADWEKSIVALNLDPDDNYDPEYHAYYATAHELVHQLQFQLTSNKLNTTLYWLVEGTADFLAAQIVEKIGYRSLAGWKTEEYFIIRNAPDYAQPDQLTYISFTEWEKFVEEGKHPYQVSNLMVLYLMSKTKKNGNGAIINYFLGASKEGKDEINFEQSFELSLQEYMVNVNQWLKGSIKTLGKLEMVSNGNIDQLVSVSEGFYRSQVFLKENFGAILESKQKIILAPEKYTYIEGLRKEFRIARSRAEVIAKDHPFWFSGNKILMNLELLPDCRSQVFNGVLMTVSSFQNQQVKAKIWENQFWLKQGIASLFAAIITEQAEVGTVEYYLQTWLKEIKEAGMPLELADLRTEAGWNQAVAKYGVSVVNGYAALAAQNLFGRKGLKPFGIWLGDSNYNNSKEAFQVAFGLSRDEFEIEFYEYLKNN
ncbi:MAG: hypothetical protein ACM3YE_09115 [Bacteroidota bacterium]